MHELYVRFERTQTKLQEIKNNSNDREMIRRNVHDHLPRGNHDHEDDSSDEEITNLFKRNPIAGD